MRHAFNVLTFELGWSKIPTKPFGFSAGYSLFATPLQPALVTCLPRLRQERDASGGEPRAPSLQPCSGKEHAKRMGAQVSPRQGDQLVKDFDRPRQQLMRCA